MTSLILSSMLYIAQQQFLLRSVEQAAFQTSNRIYCFQNLRIHMIRISSHQYSQKWTITWELNWCYVPVDIHYLHLNIFSVMSDERTILVSSEIKTSNFLKLSSTVDSAIVSKAKWLLNVIVDIFGRLQIYKVTTLCKSRFRINLVFKAAKLWSTRYIRNFEGIFSFWLYPFHFQTVF